jgi:ABC-type polysaccharide/polyol phosphate export permease
LAERIIYALYFLALVLVLWILLNAAGEKLDVDNRNNHGPIYELQRFGRELKKYREYIFFAAKADLNAEVANSYLNRLWWILEPLFSMLVYVIVFGQIMGRSIENYATFVFSALIMWNYFSHIINYSVKCIRSNRDIVTKIYMPKYVLLLTNMALNFIKMLFSMAVLLVMLLLFRVQIGVYVLWIIPAYLLMTIVCFGVGMLFMHYGVFVDDLAYAVSILLTMLMFLSGIFYDPYTTLREPLDIILLCANPVALFVNTMRDALFENLVSNVPLLGAWGLLGILIMYIGLHTVYKNENGYVKVI